MASADDRIRHELEVAARTVGPLEIDERSLVAAVRVRRAARMGMAITACCLLAATSAWIAVEKSGGPAQPAGPTVESTTPGRAPFPQQTRSFACGQTIAPPVTRDAPTDPVRLHVTPPRRVSGGTPEVDVEFVARRSTSVPVPTRPTAARLLLLRKGKIVAGQDLLSRGRPQDGVPTLRDDQLGVARAIRLNAGGSFHETLKLPSGSICPGFSWNQLWSSPDVDAVVVASYNSLEHRGSLSEDHLNADPLLVDEQTLS